MILFTLELSIVMSIPFVLDKLYDDGIENSTGYSSRENNDYEAVTVKSVQDILDSMSESDFRQLTIKYRNKYKVTDLIIYIKKRFKENKSKLSTTKADKLIKSALIECQSFSYKHRRYDIIIHTLSPMFISIQSDRRDNDVETLENVKPSLDLINRSTPPSDVLRYGQIPSQEVTVEQQLRRFFDVLMRDYDGDRSYDRRNFWQQFIQTDFSNFESHLILDRLQILFKHLLTINYNLKEFDYLINYLRFDSQKSYSDKVSYEVIIQNNKVMIRRKK
jgi:hypothetical protein